MKRPYLIALLATLLVVGGGAMLRPKMRPGEGSGSGGGGAAPAAQLPIGLLAASPDSDVFVSYFPGVQVAARNAIGTSAPTAFYRSPREVAAANIGTIMAPLGHPVAINFSVFDGSDGTSASRLPNTSSCQTSGWTNSTCQDDIASAAGTFATTYLTTGDYFYVGNEQIDYFKTGASGAGQRAAYATLLDKIETAVRAACAGCYLGVWESYEDEDEGDLETLYDATYDVFGLTVYAPFVGTPDCSATGATAAIDELTLANAFIDGMAVPPGRWAITETGICTSSTYGGSEAIQADWAEDLRTWITAEAGTVDPDHIIIFVGLDGNTSNSGCNANGAVLAPYTCSLGIRTTTNQPKTAYGVLFP
jgi:hypothetical protein